MGEAALRGQTWDGEVHKVEQQSPSLVRVELGGDGLEGFRSLGAPDEACVFEFPVPAAAPGLVPNAGRWYSLHEVGPNSMALGIVQHPGGLASNWASKAKAGDTLRITRHKSWFRRPAAAAWQILLGDITAVPAIARIITESAHLLPTRAVIEIPDAGDQQDWPAARAADIEWMLNPQAPSRLSDLVRNLELPPGDGYIYVAGEVAETRAARKFLSRDLKLPNDSFGAVGYWRRGT
ncbi:siderophore-interacting protein [Sporichthya sp.]|uniref:siderophore-interacting protein n=1 Tax=Sporichthya sp. TaxID=65475 RepID=UPI001843556D|nr:siderophore-interacting protein [Sporichthya sp.]MBA3744335.1 siderophore-interacting protein [Sporichthya sp.]